MGCAARFRFLFARPSVAQASLRRQGTHCLHPWQRFGCSPHVMDLQLPRVALRTDRLDGLRVAVVSQFVLCQVSDLCSKFILQRENSHLPHHWQDYHRFANTGVFIRDGSGRRRQCRLLCDANSSIPITQAERLFAGSQLLLANGLSAARYGEPFLCHSMEVQQGLSLAQLFFDDARPAVYPMATSRAIANALSSYCA